MFPDSDHFKKDGALFLPSLLSPDVACELAHELAHDGLSRRHLMGHPAVANLLTQSAVVDVVEPLLGEGCFAFKATLFDKNLESNWLVSWHQDVFIPVREQAEVKGWGNWSFKDGIQYVEPPESILKQIVALRIHLDDCEPENGPLRIRLGSHKLGRVLQRDVASASQTYPELAVTGVAGSALLMSPLLVHASSKVANGRRRVLHIEFTNTELPTGLSWHFS